MAQLGVNLPTLIVYIVNFLILLGIIYVFAYKPLLRAMDQRSERIRESLAAADRAREEEMGRARQDVDAFIERARSDIQRERDAAIEEVRVSFGDLAITAAERVIRRSLDRRAHQDLIAQVLEEGGENLRKGS